MPDSQTNPILPSDLAALLRRVRARTLALVAPLSVEDMAVQSMPDASPVKWHLAHTTWFFERFILIPHGGAAPFNSGWDSLFNSYYETLGPRYPRPARGLLTRPALDAVLEWRAHVDQALERLLQAEPAPELASLILLGLNHEQQHQELIQTDVKHLQAQNPLRLPATTRPRGAIPPLGWIDHPGGLMEIGHRGPGFAFDIEGPRHHVWLSPFQLADRPVCNGEWLRFMADGGYASPRHWLSDGWAAVQRESWEAPLYWYHGEDGRWWHFTLEGCRPVDPAEPVCHLSHYEADAYARWAGLRLPTEMEWEAAMAAHFNPGTPGQEEGEGGIARHPAPISGRETGRAVWEWTASAYLPYPGYRPAAGAVGEYNGKFMSGQMVLRGASVATPPGHSRASYRNFFPAAARWQFSGLRLARHNC
ncbi:ergothioneine biosynthesis protein EgtB [Niveispirillum sp. SYP-B3756]|uniref:ergothioneine biosynthesis protein EgtB n=1 Tax=Niveispirillum sp. SYP-B3756 TaxID=2662178 RepID=UPI001290C1A6|nr:ergothioneine biosynthesis protein EgtB [Niveispirillum sp. SYP-B3756]MQP66252.1 ergothioneine biosynthesis protein EgtB [Niveispirillum sp. SYP-B3756]